MEMVTYKTADAVIDALGGTVEAARKCERKPQAVTNWRSRGIPPEMFVLVNDMLAEKNAVAAASAFAGMVESATAGAAA